jgi:hypothetical protein
MSRPGLRHCSVPFIVLVGQGGSDQQDQDGAVGEDADHIGASADVPFSSSWGLLDQICRQVCFGESGDAKMSAIQMRCYSRRLVGRRGCG